VDLGRNGNRNSRISICPFWDFSKLSAFNHFLSANEIKKEEKEDNERCNEFGHNNVESLLEFDHSLWQDVRVGKKLCGICKLSTENLNSRRIANSTPGKVPSPHLPPVPGFVEVVRVSQLRLDTHTPTNERYSSNGRNCWALEEGVEQDLLINH
jgi:hypothetical protein